MSELGGRIRRFTEWMALAPAGRALANRVLTIRPCDRLLWLRAQAGGTSFHTLHALLDVAYEHLDDAPAESLALTELVLQLVRKEPHGPFHAHLHGRAWHERANALRFTGNPLASWHAYRRAARIFVDDGLGDLALAASKRGEALARHQLGDSDADGTLAMLRTARTVCEARGDVAGVARCHLYEGVLHFENDRFAAATAEFGKALVLATRLGDLLTIARLRLNLGNCALERGDRAAALQDFAHATEYFERTGMVADRRRVVWAMARIFADDGAIDRAIRTLEGVAEEMDAAGLHVDAALARRDIVEVLVLANQLPRAAAIARGVMETLARARLFRDAMRTIILQQQASREQALDDQS